MRRKAPVRFRGGLCGVPDKGRCQPTLRYVATQAVPPNPIARRATADAYLQRDNQSETHPDCRAIFSPEMRERAVRMVQEHRTEHRSQWAAMVLIAAKIGCTAETLRR